MNRRWFHLLFHKRASFVSSRLAPSFNQSKKYRFLKLLRLLSFLFFLGTVVSVVGASASFLWVSRDLPNPQRVVRQEGFSTKINDRNGSLLYDVYQNVRSVPVTYDQIPAYLREATVATEDKNFYQHGGFDPVAPFRIVYELIRYHRLIGGSTLTQQLVKNVLLTNERSIVRKYREFLLSVEIERSFTKNQIIQMYLNEAPYGASTRGVGAASEVYFHKEPKDLSLVECAILAGLPQLPSIYSPFSGKVDSSGKPYWVARTIGVLRNMREDKYITADQEKEADTQLASEQFSKQAIQINAPHFVFYIKDQLEQMFGTQMVEGGGLRVTTTLDLNLQNKVQDVVSQEIAKVANLHITNGSAMVMNPNTGEILAMVGSKDYFAKDFDGQFNVAVDGLRQPGSSIKPVTYLLAFRRGFTPASVIMDTPTTFPGGQGLKDYAPKNYDGKFRGPVQLRFALGSSLNIPAVKLLARVGVPNMLSLAYDMGFSTLAPSTDNQRRLGLSVTLGGGAVHLIDSVTSYSAFANGGNKVEPVSILKVEDKDGNVIYQSHPIETKRVMTPQEAFLIDNVLSDNNARLLSFGPNSQLNVSPGVAVKTGTTNNQVDNWTIGWSKNAIVGVWVGNNDNSPMKQVASGLTGASPIWQRVMKELISEGYKDPTFDVPSGVSQQQVDTISGYPSHDNFPTRSEYFIDGTLPQLPDPIHTLLKLCQGQQKLASEADIASGAFDQKEFIVMKEDDPVSSDGVNRWQQGIDQWISTQTDSRYHVPTDTCDTTSVFVSFNSPHDQTNFSGNSVDIDVSAASEVSIDHVDIYANDALVTTLKNRPYKTTLSLPTGKVKLTAKAVRTDGVTGTSQDVHIGVGGIPWNLPDATPTPAPTPTPSPSPTPSPTPLLGH